MLHLLALALAVLVLGPQRDAHAEDSAEPTPTPPAPDLGPYLWVRPALGVAVGPLGLIADVRAQVRGPLHRSESMVFRATYGGIGGRVAVTPAFVDVGPRFSLAPIDVFDVDVQLGVMGLWRSSSGLLPYDALVGKLDAQRKERKDTAENGGIVYATVTPTLKLKGGPVIAFVSVDFSFLRVLRAGDSPYVYEPSRDLLIRDSDVVISVMSGVFIEPFDGVKTAARLRVGPLVRHRQSLLASDRSTAIGGAASLRPGRKPGWPSLFLAVLGYVRDADRALGPPALLIQANWELEHRKRP